jgi:hypothetical protein
MHNRAQCPLGGCFACFTPPTCDCCEDRLTAETYCDAVLFNGKDAKLCTACVSAKCPLPSGFSTCKRDYENVTSETKKEDSMAGTRRAPAKRAPEDESREEAFVRLANFRVGRAVKVLNQIGNLGNYPHGPKQAAKIVETLRTAVDMVETRLSAKKSAGLPGFDVGEEPEENGEDD